MLLDNFLKSFRRLSNKVVTVKNWILVARWGTSEQSAIQRLRVRDIRRRGSKYHFLLVIPVSSFGLGTWQVFRKFEKDAELENLMERCKHPPLDLPENLDELKDLEWYRLRVKGRFDHSKEIYLGPRPKVDENNEFSLLSKVKGGYLVITPFILSDRNLTILVNRGWVSSFMKLPEHRQEGQITEEVEIVGQIKHSEKRAPFTEKNKPKRNVWFYRDVEKMCEVTGAYPIYIEADAASSVPGGPIGGQSYTQPFNNHTSYIITWYSLSALTSYMYYIKSVQKLTIIL